MTPCLPIVSNLRSRALHSKSRLKCRTWRVSKPRSKWKGREIPNTVRMRTNQTPMEEIRILGMTRQTARQRAIEVLITANGKIVVKNSIVALNKWVYKCKINDTSSTTWKLKINTSE